MKKKLLLAFCALLTATALYAVPAKPVKKTVLLADGSTAELTLRGDEHYSYYTDDSGQPFQLRADGRVERSTMTAVGETWTRIRQQRIELAETTAPAGTRRGAARRVGTAGTTKGTQRGLVILMQFQDVSFVTASPKATFNRFFNEVGYSGGGNAGSVKDYFLAQSYGQLEIEFDVVGPYTSSRNMAYYGAPSGNSNDARPAHLIAEAVDAASAEVDFSNYDWDGDGVVDQVFVVYAGYNQAQGADENTIWPHEWAISAGTGSPKRYNGVTINTYGCSSELMGNGRNNTGIMDGIGTACHEFSHCLGLPDMYDTQGDNYAMSYWDVMCAGSYNDDSHTPAGYTAYERWFADWLQPTELNTLTRITDMKPLATNPEAYVLYNDANHNEYYLLENRQPVGFDAGLYGHGLLIVHVDYNENAWAGNTVNITATRQRMTVIPADGNFNVTGVGLAGDPWPGYTGNTQLTNFTTPAAILYNNNTDGTKFLSKNIDNITENTTAHTVSFVACRPELAVPSPDGGTATAAGDGFKVTWPAISGATSYQLELTEIGTAATNPADALLSEYDFSAFKTTSTGFTDLSSKLANYGLSNWKGSKLFTSPNNLKIGTSSATGYLQTPSWWRVPESQEITFVFGNKLVTAGKKVTVNLTFESAIEGGTMADVVTASESFEVTADGQHVVSFSIPKQNNLYRLTITPDAQIYMNYLAIYDGTWTAEKLGIAGARSSHRAATVLGIYTTPTNSYTFTGLNPANRYIFRVRTIGEEGVVSQWSAEQTFSFDTTPILGIEAPAEPADIRYYDLQGREVDASHRGLTIVRQGGSVKKVVR